MSSETKGTGVAPEGIASAKPQGFDLVLVRLRSIVEQLEGGNLTLEQSLGAFEEGVRLSRSGAQILDAAEQRVEILMRDSDQSAPFGQTPVAPAGDEQGVPRGTDLGKR